MTELRTNIEKELPSEEEYYEQLELNFQIHKIEKQKEILLKKIYRLENDKKKHPSEDYSNKVPAINILTKELNENYNKVLKQIKDEYNFSKILENLEKIKKFRYNLNKALKKGKINVNVHRLTSSHYSIKQNELLQDLKRLNVIVESYFIFLNNRKLELEAELKFKKNSKLKDNNLLKNAKARISDELKQIIERLSFFNYLIHNFKI